MPQSLASHPTHERGERLLRVAWATRPWGRTLLLVGLAGVAVALGVRALDGGPWDVSDVVSDLLVPAAALYVALALLRNGTELRASAGGALRVRHGPLPFLPGARLAPGELASISTSSWRTRFGAPWRWRVDLVSHGLEHHTVCFGGVAERELAGRTAADVRAFLQLPAAGVAGPAGRFQP
jgi:hypothetical protein